MNFSPRPTRADIDLRALIHNLRHLRSFCTAGQGVLAVVKADAYGHGAVPVSQALEQEGVEHFGVATLEEAVELRDAGIRTPILVLGGCYPGQEGAFIQLSLTAAVFSLTDLQRINSYAEAEGTRFSVHLKCDTGMGRVGFFPIGIPQLIEFLQGAVGIEVAGLMSHLACADEPGSPTTQTQIVAFSAICKKLRDSGIEPAAIHLSNSAGLVAWDIPECNMVRPGIALYGGTPLPDRFVQLDLQPVMTFSTRISQLRTLEAGRGVSYGHTFHTERITRLATLPVGYADGYNRLFSNCGEVLVRGRRAPVIGRVCMDWILVDVTDIAGAEIGDPVVLLGTDGDQTISAAEWADKLGSIDYEIFCRIGARVPRYY